MYFLFFRAFELAAKINKQLFDSEQFSMKLKPPTIDDSERTNTLIKHYTLLKDCSHVVCPQNRSSSRVCTTDRRLDGHKP